jgi:uncharacterized membrane protein
MILIEFHLGLRQVVMALMNWAIDVPQKLLQSDARLFPKLNLIFILLLWIIFYVYYLIKYIIERL